MTLSHCLQVYVLTYGVSSYHKEDPSWRGAVSAEEGSELLTGTIERVGRM